MLTEKECNEALDWLYALSVPCKEEVHEHRSSFLGEKYNLIKQLIEEHFSNPPLKFEELKEDMFVWDNKHHTYILIDRIEETYNKTIYFYAIGWECCENMEFEPNRFYRKEVQE